MLREGEEREQTTHDAVEFVVDAEGAEIAGPVGQRERGLVQPRHFVGIDPQVDVCGHGGEFGEGLDGELGRCCTCEEFVPGVVGFRVRVAGVDAVGREAVDGFGHVFDRAGRRCCEVVSWLLEECGLLGVGLQ